MFNCQKQHLENMHFYQVQNDANIKVMMMPVCDFMIYAHEL